MQLLHDMRAMRLYRPLARIQRAGDLLVEAAGNDLREHCALAWREGLVAFTQLALVPDKLAALRVAAQGRADGGKQCAGVDRLGEEVDRAATHRADAGGDVAVAREEDHRQRI